MKTIISFVVVLLLSFSNTTQSPNAIKVAGSMRATMREGKLAGQIQIDSISRPDFYGIGPLEYLNGELLLFNGKSFTSTIENGKEVVKQDKSAKAPFFVYVKVKNWKEIELKESFKSIPELEKDIERLASSSGIDTSQPFVFQLKGKFRKVDYHVLTNQKKEESDPHHKIGQIKFNLDKTESSILGFFSKQHQGVFTHHDSFVHMHIMDENETKMGHVDQVMGGENSLTLLIGR